MIRVHLEPYEVTMAAQVGLRRSLNSISAGHKDKHGFGKPNKDGKPGDRWGVSIEGACGELAVAKAMNVYWNGAFNDYRGHDVGNVQVRTGPEPGRCLIVRPDDLEIHSESEFWLVIGLAPDFVVHGWMIGKNAVQRRFLMNPNDRVPAWFVPKDELNDPEFSTLYHR